MSFDVTESFRIERVQEINSDPGSRERLEQAHGQVWDTEQMKADFNVTGFGAPYVVVKRKADNAIGSLEFQHSPRFYYSFRENE